MRAFWVGCMSQQYLQQQTTYSRNRKMHISGGPPEKPFPRIQVRIICERSAFIRTNNAALQHHPLFVRCHRVYSLCYLHNVLICQEPKCIRQQYLYRVQNQIFGYTWCYPPPQNAKDHKNYRIMPPIIPSNIWVRKIDWSGQLFRLPYQTTSR